MLYVRSLIFNILFYANLFVVMLTGLPFLFGNRNNGLETGRLWGRSSLWLLKNVCGVTLEYRGLENVPAGACIVASKHQSILETFAIIPHMSDFTFVVKEQLKYVPIFGLYMIYTDQIAINRKAGSSAMTQVVQGTRKAFGEGRKLMIFPEGTRKAVGAPPDYKFGVAQVYGSNNVCCVPVALNAGLFWPRRSFLRRPGNLVIEFLPPIEPGLDKKVFLRTLQDKIETATNKLVSEAVAADPRLAGVVYTPGDKA